MQYAKRRPTSIPSTLLQQRGNTDPCRTSSKKGSRQCPKTAVQNNPFECSLALGMVAAEAQTRVAAQQAGGNLPWFGVDDPSQMQRLQTDYAERMQKISNFQLGGPEKLTGADDPFSCFATKWRGLADMWDICMNLTMPTTKWVQNGIHRKLK